MRKLESKLPKNPRIYEPRATVGNEEIIIQATKLEVMKGVRGDLNHHKGESNLTRAELRGKKSLLRRIRGNEIVISMTDKSGKSVVCTPATYLAAVKVHTDKDEEVSSKTLREIETRVNRHMRTLRRVTGMGENHPNLEQKLAGATTNQDSGAPNLYIMWKDHKEDFATKHQTRPVCDGTQGPLARISEVLVKILGSLVEGDTERKASCRSTEEMLREVKECIGRMEAVNQ